MKQKIIFVFEFGKRKPKEVTKINRDLFGYTDKSFHGKYTYKRKGLLSDFNIDRIAKGVLMTDLVNDKRVLEILHSMGTKRIKRYYLELDKVIG